MADSLRETKLFSLAADYCRQELRRQDLTQRQRALFAVQLIRVFTDQANSALPDARKPFWRQAIEAGESFRERNPDNSFLVLVQVQSALSSLTHGTLLRYELESGAGSPATRTEALTSLRAASRQIEEIQSTVNTLQIKLGAKVKYQNGLLEKELSWLEENLKFYAARCFLNRALLYEKDDQLNRINAMLQVTQTHESLLRSLSEDDSTWWKVQLDRLIVYRYSQEYQKGMQLIKQLMTKRRLIPNDLVGNMIAENLRLLVLIESLGEAQELALKEVQSNEIADFELARVEAFLHFANSENSADSPQWQRKAVELTKQIERDYGRYWSRRANLLLVKSAEANPSNVDTMMLVKLGDSNYLKGEFDEAIRAYESAAGKAKTADPKEYFALMFKAALVQQQRKQFADASKRFESLSIESKSDDRAANSHRLAILNAAEMAKKDSNELSRYIQLLEQQLKNWPTAKETGQARIWYSKMLVREKRFADAVRVLIVTDPNDEIFENALRNCRQIALDQVILLRANEDESSQSKIDELCVILQPMHKAAFGESDSISNQRLWMMAMTGEIYSNANRKLTTAELTLFQESFDQKLEIAFDWQIAALSTLAYEYGMNQDDPQQFLRYVTRLVQISPDQALVSLERMFLTGAIPDSVADEMGKVVALFAGKDDLLQSRSQSRLMTVRAKTLASSGRVDDAIKLFEKIIKDKPNDLQIRIDFARQLSLSKTAAHKKSALDQWRIVAKKSESQSDDWYLAKLEVAKSLVAIGDKKKAKDFLLYLQQVPGWKQSAIQGDFKQLLSKLK